MKDQTEKTKSKKKRQSKGVDEELMSKLGESFHTETTLMMQQRESCAKIAETAEPYQTADLIRARGQA